MGTVRQLLNSKPDEFFTVAPATTLRESLKLMHAHDIGVVMIVDENRLQGIFSERDLARELVKDEKLTLNTPVSALMTVGVFYIKPDQTVDECMALMIEKHIRHLPVLDEGKVIGMVSIRDVVREIVSSKDITIRSLENYIMGREYA